MADPSTLEITCREFVEMATDYVEDALPELDRVMVEEHLTVCDWCVTYLEQLEATRRAMRSLGDEPVEEEVGDELILAFRRWREERGAR